MNRGLRVLQEGRRRNPFVHGPKQRTQETSPQDFARLGGDTRNLRTQKSKNHETKNQENQEQQLLASLGPEAYLEACET